MKEELIEKLENVKIVLYNLAQYDEVGVVDDAIQALSQSEGESITYDIDFNGHILARVQIINNQPTIIASMNGYGNAVDLDKITIKPQTK